MNCVYCGATRVVKLDYYPYSGFVCEVHFKEEMEVRKKFNQATRRLAKKYRWDRTGIKSILLPIHRFKELYESQESDREIRNAFAYINSKKGE